MKKLFASLLLCAFALTVRAQVPTVWFTNGAFLGGDTSDTIINIRAQNNPSIFGGSYFSTFARGTNIATTNGVLPIKLIPADYTISFAGIAASWTIHVTNSTMDLNATDLTTNLVRYSGVQSITGAGSVTVTPPTGSGGNWTITGTGDGNGDGGTGNVIGPPSATSFSFPLYKGTSGVVLTNKDGSGVVYSPASFDSSGAATAGTNGLAISSGLAAFRNTNTLEAAGTATASTNSLGVASGLAAFRGTNTLASTNVATASAVGLVKVDNSTITIAADGTISSTTGGSGNVTGPGSATTDNFAAYNGSGTLLKDSTKSAASFDTTGMATAATNALGIGSGLAANVATNRFAPTNSPLIFKPRLFGTSDFQDGSLTNIHNLQSGFLSTGGAQGNYDIAWGFDSEVYSDYAIAVGDDAIVAARSHTGSAFGNSVFVDGYASHAAGDSINLTGGDSTAFGYNITLIGTNSFVWNGDPDNDLEVSANSRFSVQATNGFYFKASALHGNGNGLTNLNPVSAFPTPLIQVTNAKASQYVTFTSDTNLTSTQNGNGWTNLTFTAAVLAPSSNATNYTINFAGADKQIIHSANTNANITFANIATNRQIDFFIYAITSSVNCNVTFPAHVIHNNGWTLTCSNATMQAYHAEAHTGTDATNVVVTGGDYYHRD